MDAFQNLSSLSCDVRIIRAKNIEFVSTGNLFVRCYLSAGNSKRVRLDSHEISPKSDLVWNESFSLDCLGTQASMNMLVHGTVAFELRCRNSIPLFGRKGKSKLLGRAEIPWKIVLESPKMETVKWAVMINKTKHVNVDIKPPAVEIEMKVGVPVVVETARRRRDECGCMDCACNTNLDYDFLAI